MERTRRHDAWHKGDLVGQKAPLKPEEIWTIPPELAAGLAAVGSRDLAIRNRYIDRRRWRSLVS